MLFCTFFLLNSTNKTDYNKEYCNLVDPNSRNEEQMNPEKSLDFTITIVMLAVVLVLGASACSKNNNSSDAGTDTDTDTDADTDTDTDADTDTDTEVVVDCSECTAPICIGSVSGKVLFADETPFVGTVQFCTTNCVNVATDDAGDFFHILAGGCGVFDWATDEPPHLALNSADGTHTQYAIGVKPETQADIDADFNFDTGTHYYYPLPGTGDNYTEADGATVTDLDGVSFDVPAGAFGADDALIQVMEFPLASWTPPFLGDVTPDVLYFIAPYFEELTSDVVLHIDPLSAGWAVNDTGTLYMLGDFGPGYLDCGDGEEHIGEFVECGTAERTGEKIVTSGINRFGWVGLLKD